MGAKKESHEFSRRYVICRCGKGHFDSTNRTWSNAELAVFRSRAKSMPGTYIERNGPIVEVDGRVVGCTCREERALTKDEFLTMPQEYFDAETDEEAGRIAQEHLRKRVSSEISENAVPLEKTRLRYEDGTVYEVSVCPFVGCGSSTVEIVQDYLGRWFYVECQSCFAKGPTAEIYGPGEEAERDAMARAVDRWNKAKR